MRLTLPVMFAALCATALLPAQVRVFGGPGSRHSSTLFAFTPEFEVKASVCIQHGQPAWKDAYDNADAFDKYLAQYKGKNVRLGKDWWTTFDTSTQVTIGGAAIPAGSYFLGLVYGRDGTFELAVIDAAKAMKAGMMPFVEKAWTVDFKAPLTLAKNVATETVKEMTIDLVADDQDVTKATFVIAWGKHTLSAPVAIQMAGAADASGDKGK